MYLKCPKQYEFRYIKGLKEPPAIVLDEGISHHDWLEKNNLSFIANGSNLRVNEATDIFESVWADKVTNNGHNSIVDREVRERGAKLVERYLEFADEREVTPTAAEAKFELQIGSVPLLGFRDLDGHMLGDSGKRETATSDYKVVKSKKSQADADGDLQLAIYSESVNKSKGQFICLTKTKDPKIVPVKATYTKRRKNWAKYVVEEVGNSIKAGNFPPCSPTHWGCSERFCGYWKLCRGSKTLG